MSAAHGEARRESSAKSTTAWRSFLSQAHRKFTERCLPEARVTGAAPGSGEAREDLRVGVDLESLDDIGLEHLGPALAGLDRIDQSKDARRPRLVFLGPEGGRGRLA